MENSLIKKEKYILCKFNMCSSWKDKCKLLINLSKFVNIFSNIKFNNSDIIYGCQSSVWIKSVMYNNRFILVGNSDAIIPRGILGLFIFLYSYELPVNVFKHDVNFVNKIGFINFISLVRNNGLFSILKFIKIHSLKYIY